MRIPYALQDFRRMREKDFLYVDKTKYIEILEDMEDYILFLRPRRFGKTLFTSILNYYYDIKHKDIFDSLFGGLYIGENKTENANQYYVLKFNFSGIDSRKEEVEQSFYWKVKIAVDYFIKANHFDIKISDQIMKANHYIDALFAGFQALYAEKIFVIIDEYDHFANDILSDDKDYFNEITGKDGFIRKFYEVFKSYAGDIIERMFITGVTPITLDALTSGFNIVKNIGNRQELNEMIGFTEDEVLNILEIFQIDTKHMDLLREYYNGYLFHKKAEHKIYNSNLLMFFLSEYNVNKGIPEDLIDTNVISDYDKITRLFDLYSNKERKRKLIEDIVSAKELEGKVKDRIGPFVKDDLKDDSYGLIEDEFISLLYYLGLLTISSDGKERFKLISPNYCISTVYSKYYLSYLYSQMKQVYDTRMIYLAMDELVSNNNIEPYKTVIETILKGLSSFDFMHFDEKYIQLIMFCIARNSVSYLVKTEYEMEGGLRADLVLLPNYARIADHYYIFEIKYIMKSVLNKDQDILEEKKLEAIEQIKKYAKTKEMKHVPNLKKYVVVAVKDELKVFEEV